MIVTPLGEEARVDYGDGAMVRDLQTGKYRRTRLFVMMLAVANGSAEANLRRHGRSAVDGCVSCSS